MRSSTFYQAFLGRTSDFRIKIKIREQLSILVAVTAVTAVGILSLVFWVNNRRLIADVALNSVSMAISMKSAQFSNTFASLHHVAYQVVNRPTLRSSLQRYTRNANNTPENWVDIELELRSISALQSGGQEVLQVVLFDANLSNGTFGVPAGTILDGVYIGTGHPVYPDFNGTMPDGSWVNIGEGNGGYLGLLNVTGETAFGIELPKSIENDFQGELMLQPNATGNGSMNATERYWYELGKHRSGGKRILDGYAVDLFPIQSAFRNKQLIGNTRTIFTADYLKKMGGLILGPLVLNNTHSLLSFTFPVYEPLSNKKVFDEVVGFATIVMNGTLLNGILCDKRGLGNTGQTLLVGPTWVNGLWNNTALSRNSNNLTEPRATAELDASEVGKYEFIYLLPPSKNYDLAGTKRQLKQYPAVMELYMQKVDPNTGQANLDSTNAEGKNVGVGFAFLNLQDYLVDWGLLIEQDKSEAFQPIVQLEKILLATVFGTFAIVMVLVWPLAHFSVRPIMKLKKATEKTTRPPGSSDTLDEGGCPITPGDVDVDDVEKGRYGLCYRLTSLTKRRKRANSSSTSSNLRSFRVPGKVPVRKHLIYDELTDLTATFNQMADQLELQYTTLEDRVIERTQELNEQKILAEEQRQIAEEQAKVAQEQRLIAEAANNAKTLFVANISHELRTPLNGIINMCDVAMDQAIARGVVDVRESLEVAVMSGKSLLHLINELLTFSKNAAGALEGRTEDEDFALEIVGKQVMAVFAKSAEERGVRLDVQDTPPDLANLVFNADIKRITQCMYNLVGNALKFTPAGGEVKVRVRLLPRQCADGSMEMLRRIDSATPNNGTDTPAKTISRSSSNCSTRPATQADKSHVLEFSVIDNGPGIPEHLHKKVFEPFIQAEMRLSKVHEGVGLGLSICRQIVKMLGGSILLRSELGVGSTFTVQMPVSMRKRSEIPPPVEDDNAQVIPWGKENKPRLTPVLAEASVSGSSRILVAEDNPTNRTVITQMLKLQKFFDVILAKDGHEALSRIKEVMEKGESFGVVLMDIQMPGLDGIECTRIVRALGYTAPIVALTAFADEGNKDACLDAGMNYFLPKPIDKFHLKQVLKTCMGYDGGSPLAPIAPPSPPASTVAMPPALATETI